MLKNIFSTILNLASLQIQNSLPLRQLNLWPLCFDKNCYRKNLHSLLRALFSLFFRDFVTLINFHQSLIPNPYPLYFPATDLSKLIS